MNKVMCYKLNGQRTHWKIFIWLHRTGSHIVNSNKHIINTTIATDSKFPQHLNAKTINGDRLWRFIQYIPKRNANRGVEVRKIRRMKEKRVDVTEV